MSDQQHEKFTFTVTVPKGGKPAPEHHAAIADDIKGALSKAFTSRGLDGTIVKVSCCEPDKGDKANTQA